MGVMDKPLVSIVTPVYNGEEYIEKCIQSVISQTYQNWEYIILNNCSTDKTPEIAEKYADKDSRIRVIDTPELLPLIKNHNYALQQISSDSRYCKMIHADDILFPTCVELMVSTSEANPTAGIVGSYSIWGQKVVSDGLPLSSTFFTGKELARFNLLNNGYTFWSPSALLIRSDLIRKRKRFYNENYLHADVETCYEILQKSDFAFVHQVLTFIRTHDESSTATITASYNKNILSNLDLFLRYGPIFLSPDEYNKHFKVKTKHYYGFLANSLFTLRERNFWRYHKQTCQKIGFAFSRLKLLRASMSQLIGMPITTVKKIAKAVI